MADGWEHVAVTYGLVFVTLGIWFWMIFAKLARLRRGAAQERSRD